MGSLGCGDATVVVVLGVVMGFICCICNICCFSWLVLAILR